MSSEIRILLFMKKIYILFHYKLDYGRIPGHCQLESCNVEAVYIAVNELEIGFFSWPVWPM